MTYDPDFDFNGAVQRLNLVMLSLDGDDLAKILSTVEYAHTVGFIVDPTKYRDALQRGDMDDLAALARALLPAVEIWKTRILPKAGAAA